jgi:hypothetical protein
MLAARARGHGRSGRRARAARHRDAYGRRISVRSRVEVELPGRRTLQGAVIALHEEGGLASVELLPDGWRGSTLSVLASTCKLTLAARTQRRARGSALGHLACAR